MTKPFLTYELQLDKLSTKKKLIINDREKAKQVLKNIGYFSLIGGYKTPFIDPMTRIYQNGTTFDDIYALYQYDQALRELIFRYLCQIEQRIRQLISYSFCKIHGTQQSAYLNPSNFNNTSANASNIQKLINILHYQANINCEHPYIVYQRSTYHNVPLWALTHTLTYGQISHFYSLLPFTLQSDISKEFPSITEHKLEKYLKILTLFRNVCAHNERLYSFRLQIDFLDTVFHEKMKIPQKGNQYLQGKRDFFGLVIALRYLLPQDEFSEFKHDLIKILKNYTYLSSRINESILLDIMGFPTNWKNITRYKIVSNSLSRQKN